MKVRVRGESEGRTVRRIRGHSQARWRRDSAVVGNMEDGSTKKGSIDYRTKSRCGRDRWEKLDEPEWSRAISIIVDE